MPPTADTPTCRPVPGNGSRRHGPGDTGATDDQKDDARRDPHDLQVAANVTQGRPHSRGANRYVHEGVCIIRIACFVANLFRTCCLHVPASHVTWSQAFDRAKEDVLEHMPI
ncbi:hypothetical protein NDU88_007409 [Pleurodeles waltl]|uniref:Uncharacterized protein n=1 Tax=Pleurodeles waltl TaxID=8319 RepID=A0AAV7QRT8_PLEWA|nr:hypothetical protein NDU88_007409 [Pleurodeles waltl]